MTPEEQKIAIAEMQLVDRMRVTSRSVQLDGEDVVFLAIVLRERKKMLREMGIHTRDTDARLAKLYRAFPEIRLANPEEP